MVKIQSYDRDSSALIGLYINSSTWNISQSGSASFDADGIFGDNPSTSNNNPGVRINAFADSTTGWVNTYRGGLRAFQNNSSTTSPNAEIKASDGSALFRGNVDIGSEDLHTAADAAQINIKQTTQDASSGLYLERPGERRGYSVYVGPPNDGLTFRANNFGTFTTTMYLDRAGKVGIGTTSLSSSRLTVNGSAQISGALKIGGTASTNEISEYVEDFASISVRFNDDDSSLVNQGQQSAYAVKIGKFVSIHGALNFALLAGDDTTNNQNRAIYIRLPYPVTSASAVKLILKAVLVS